MPWAICVLCCSGIGYDFLLCSVEGTCSLLSSGSLCPVSTRSFLNNDEGN
jgi:hypothetical protein